MIDLKLTQEPIFQELLNTVNETTGLKDFKIPYIIKNKILMGEGVWNGYTYTRDELKKAGLNTDFNKVEDLFLDHDDDKAQTWIGRVKNIYVDNDGNTRGDLHIMNLQAAINLHCGAKFGISPKLHGRADNFVVRDFAYDNWSIVYNPACKLTFLNADNKKDGDISTKTLYIELSDDEKKKKEEEKKKKECEEELALISAMEEKRKQLGKSVSEFYAIPKEPPSASKLPIFDEEHCRNAMARFNQIEGVSSEEKAIAAKRIIKAAKKFGIKVDEFEKQYGGSKMLSEDEKKEIISEITNKLSEEIKKLSAELPVQTVKEDDPVTKTFSPEPSANKGQSPANFVSIKNNEEKPEEKPEEKKPEEEKKPDVTEELKKRDEEISKMKEEFSVKMKELDEVKAKLSQPAPMASKIDVGVSKPEKTVRDLDRETYNFFIKQESIGQSLI